MGSTPDDAPQGVDQQQQQQHVDTAMAKKILWKIDRTVIPLLFVTYMLNFMDKTILSSASVFGLRDDTVSSCHFS